MVVTLNSTPLFPSTLSCLCACELSTNRIPFSLKLNQAETQWLQTATTFYSPQFCGWMGQFYYLAHLDSVLLLASLGLSHQQWYRPVFRTWKQQQFKRAKSEAARALKFAQCPFFFFFFFFFFLGSFPWSREFVLI